MLFAIDIGNSNVVIGLWDGDDWRHVWRLPTRATDDTTVYYETRLQDLFLENGIRPGPQDRAIISSVVPVLTVPFEHLFGHFVAGPVTRVHPTLYPGLSFRINRPDEIGTDLVCNAVAARQLYQSNVVVVDFGTALTFTTCTLEGEILGVSILPGLKTAISALFQKTAQLPEVPLELPPSVLGTNTTEAIQSGVLMGYVGLVRHMVASIRSEVGSDFLAIGTGGLSSVLHPLAEDFDYINSQLTLEGLRLIDAHVADTA